MRIVTDLKPADWIEIALCSKIHEIIESTVINRIV
jgi:hypothetical protein